MSSAGPKSVTIFNLIPFGKYGDTRRDINHIMYKMK